MIQTKKEICKKEAAENCSSKHRDSIYRVDTKSFQAA